MDDADALPSSYISKVLTSLSKWCCKLQSITDFFDAEGEAGGNANGKKILNVSHEQFQRFPMFDVSYSSHKNMIPTESFFLPRISARATTLDGNLNGIIEEIHKINTTGICNGYTRA